MAIEVKIQRKLNTFELNIDFKSDSKRIGILGASGCGKSMTLKSIAGIEPPESGLIKIEGKTVYDSENKVNLKPQKRNIGYLFQNYALFPTMTVEKNIAAGLKGKKQENANRVREMIEKFQLTGLEKRFPSELSGGQQQRVHRQMPALRLAGLCGKGKLLLLEQGMLFLYVGGQQVFLFQEKEADQENRRRTAGQGLVQSDRALYAETPAAL